MKLKALMLAVSLIGESESAADVIPTNMVWIPPGQFMMGSPKTEPARWPDEGPQTKVTITRGFYIGIYEVTQAEYLSVMGVNPSHFVGDYPVEWTERRPVDSVSWDDAVKYCETLTKRERKAGRLSDTSHYRLPTEAEWEYACRAGTTTAFHFGDLCYSGMANFNGKYEYPPCPGRFEDGKTYCLNVSRTRKYLQKTMPGGVFKRPNAWGLHDMHGNVWEWCMDWIDFLEKYSGEEETDPIGPRAGYRRALRGGGWNDIAAELRSAYRSTGEHYYSAPSAIGFRVVLSERKRPAALQPFTVTLEIWEDFDLEKRISIRIETDQIALFSVESSSNLVDWITEPNLQGYDWGNADLQEKSVGLHTDRYGIEFEGPMPTNSSVFYRAVAR